MLWNQEARCLFIRHPLKDETFVILHGRVKVTTHNNDGSLKESVVLCPDEGKYGVDIPKSVWHKIESLEIGSIFFECKEGPFVPHEEDGILELSKINEEGFICYLAILLLSLLAKVGRFAELRVMNYD